MEIENRTKEQLLEHYKIEKKLAKRLRSASARERRYLYSSLYDEMFRLVPLHPQMTQKSSPEKTKRSIDAQMEFIKPFLRRDIAFMELGPGDCAFVCEASRFVKKAYAIDVSSTITNNITLPQNFRLIISDGSSIPLPPNSINVAYSNQLMEHLHPDDAAEQLKNVYRSLVPGGVYICITPSRLSGPHDISKYFDKVATGFHLKEYTTLELNNLFKQAGFCHARVYLKVRGKYLCLPVLPVIMYEIFLESLQRILKKTAGRNLPYRLFLDTRFAGFKSCRTVKQQ